MTSLPHDAVSAPASSANLGAGFDVFGMALSLYAEVGLGPAPDGAHPIDGRHPARVPFERLGGTGELWLRTDIPMARGLGFSGAARVAAAGLGAVVAADGDPGALEHRRTEILEVTAELEGHGDNVAASVNGGVTAYVSGRVVEMPLGPVIGAARFVAWIPDVTTSTDASRRHLPSSVERVDAVANIGAAAQFVLAVARDDPALLRGGTADRLHQAERLPAVPGAADALREGLGAGAWCAWLSGSGPTVALLCAEEDVGRVVAALPDGGHTKVLSIEPRGVHVSA
jgi:homoserine kinase